MDFNKYVQSLIPQGVLDQDNGDFVKFLELFSNEFGELYKCAKDIEKLVDVNLVNEDFLDLLAVLYDVSYISVGLPIEKKRNLIRNAVRLYKEKGTSIGIQRLAKIVLGSDKLKMKSFYKNTAMTYGGKIVTRTMSYDKLNFLEDDTGYLAGESVFTRERIWLEMPMLGVDDFSEAFNLLTKFRYVLKKFASATSILEVVFLGLVEVVNAPKINAFENSGVTFDDILIQKGFTVGVSILGRDAVRRKYAKLVEIKESDPIMVV